MAETYSVGTKGLNANSPFTPKLLKLPDSACAIGSQQAAMATNTQVLVKGPDGSQAWYTLDSERSTPANPVLLKVGP